MAQHIYKDYERVIAELKKYDNFIILRGYSNLDENYDDYESVYYEDCVGTAQSIDEALGKMFLSMISEMHEGIENNDDEETLYNDYIPVVPLYPINATCGLVIRFGMNNKKFGDTTISEKNVDVWVKILPVKDKDVKKIKSLNKEE